MDRKTTFVAWNANGLKNKVQDLREFLTRMNPDITLISETKLDTADKIKIPGFNLVRNDNTSRSDLL